jgi:hydroxyversicolorone monooxygenase
MPSALTLTPTAPVLAQYNWASSHERGWLQSLRCHIKDPKSRRVRVVAIGAGYSGILLAYKLERELQNVEYVVYEKNGNISGAWFENRYPNCACDGTLSVLLPAIGVL